MEVNDAKQVFRQCGTCSQTFGHLLNREWGEMYPVAERALDPLAGGILNQGHQCGMLWGATLATGLEAYRQHQNLEEASLVALEAAKRFVDSFQAESNTANCREVIGRDLRHFWGMAGFALKTIITGMDNSQCFNLAEKWAPEAIETARQSLAEGKRPASMPLNNCASMVVKQMGATEREAAMVAGFAGGLGLSGHGCGALAAAIWLQTLRWIQANPDKTPPIMGTKEAKRLLKTFQQQTDGEMTCVRLTGRSFDSVAEHSAYLEEGGCQTLIRALAETAS